MGGVACGGGRGTAKGCVMVGAWQGRAHPDCGRECKFREANRVRVSGKETQQQLKASIKQSTLAKEKEEEEGGGAKMRGCKGEASSSRARFPRSPGSPC